MPLGDCGYNPIRTLKPVESSYIFHPTEILLTLVAHLVTTHMELFPLHTQNLEKMNVVVALRIGGLLFPKDPDPSLEEDFSGSNPILSIGM